MQTFYQKLQQQHKAGLTRHLSTLQSDLGPLITVDNQTLLNFCSNDYLGFSKHPKLVQAAIEALTKYGLSSGGSAQVIGYHALHAQAEQIIARVLQLPYVTLFTNGYLANQAILQCFGEKTNIFLDKHVHASILDGAQLSGSPYFRFHHQDIQHLQYLLTKHPSNGTPLIVVEGVYSMDGETAPLNELRQIALQHNALLVVDDAHGLGVLGLGGRGSLFQDHSTIQEVPIYMGTLGKAMGCYGAFIGVRDQTLHQIIHQFARSYRYTTALPFHLAAAIEAAFLLLEQEPMHHQQLQANIEVWKTLCHTHNLPFTDSAIQMWTTGCIDTALALSKQLLTQGFLVKAIRPPTVIKQRTGLRITLSAFHTREMISCLFKHLIDHTQ
jgi:8-amino-7-oxononanoate synthase